MSDQDKSRGADGETSSFHNLTSAQFSALVTKAGEAAQSVTFSVDASLISRLGRELVRQQETAVAELAKNAYDADASFVKLFFDDAEVMGGSLKVIDDGHGMSDDELHRGFLRLATDEKVRRPASPKFARTRAGRKGIGRFAVQRLGDTLRLTTQTAESQHARVLTVDWRQFSAGRELAQVEASLSTVEKEREHGTTLEIGSLREAWSDDSLKEVYRYVSDLIQTVLPADAEDPGFRVELYKRTRGKATSVFDVGSEVLTHALAVVEADVNEAGLGTWTIRSERLGIDEPPEPIGQAVDATRPFEELRNVRLTAHYFIIRQEFLPKGQVRLLREVLKREGGIRVFRNGFRVRPYGASPDDWLGLDRSSRVRTVLPPHANNNFLGYVELVDPAGELFEETSSREGLIENKAFQELTDFASRTLTNAALRVAGARGKKQKASQEGWEQEAADADEAIDDVVSDLQLLGADVPQLTHGQTQARVSSVLAAVRKMRSTHQKERDALLAELGLLRVLASLGLVIGEFTHEIRQTIGAAYLGARQLVRRLKAGTTERSRAEDLAAAIDRFRTYTRYFDNVVAESVHRELTEVDLREAAERFLETTEPIARRFGIRLHAVEGVGDRRARTCPMHASEVSSVLSNLFSNSAKAIRRAGGDGAVLIRVGTDGPSAFLEFLDTGDGIPRRNWDRVFDAFFTTSGLASDSDEILSGSGLGLKIVRDIAQSYQGRAYVTDALEGFSTAVRFEVPKSGAKE